MTSRSKWTIPGSAAALLLALLATLPETVAAADCGIGADGCRPGGSGTGPVVGGGSITIMHKGGDNGISAGSSADPDRWGLADSSGMYWAVFTVPGGQGAAVPPGNGQAGCTPSAGGTISTPPVTTPPISIVTSPSAPIADGFGGLVGVKVTADLVGYSDKMGDPVSAGITNCVTRADGTVEPEPGGAIEARIGYTAGSAPVWYWSDGAPGESGWRAQHTYWRASAPGFGSAPGYGVWDVKDAKGNWAYIMQATLMLHVTAYVGSAAQSEDHGDPRFRVFPVREVQSVLR